VGGLADLPRWGRYIRVCLSVTANLYVRYVFSA
jgi:hypothetical protein